MIVSIWIDVYTNRNYCWTSIHRIYTDGGWWMVVVESECHQYLLYGGKLLSWLNEMHIVQIMCVFLYTQLSYSNDFSIHESGNNINITWQSHCKSYTIICYLIYSECVHALHSNYQMHLNSPVTKTGEWLCQKGKHINHRVVTQNWQHVNISFIYGYN